MGGKYSSRDLLSTALCDNKKSPSDIDSKYDSRIGFCKRNNLIRYPRLFRVFRSSISKSTVVFENCSTSAALLERIIHDAVILHENSLLSAREGIIDSRANSMVKDSRGRQRGAR